MSKDYLLEIGLEELPASFLERGLESLEAAAQEALAGARLAPSAVDVMGTPRRMTLRLAGLPERQPDREEAVAGPPWSVAFKDGQPTKAAEGFARKNGVELSSLEKITTDKGEYVGAVVRETGRPAAEVLAELLPEICRKISFPKVMRWGTGEFAFGRPVHWMVSLLGEEVVPFDFASVTAGRVTRGHRFLAPASFELTSAADYEAALAERHVVVRFDARRDAMNDALASAADELGGTLVRDDFLVGECLHLVEEPFVVPGAFDESFLALPDEVVISVMRDHQRYFAVRDGEGKLMPRYLNVVNTAENPATIAKGNDRVLRARLADARFFVDEDKKSPLESRLTKLDTVTFHRKLGSVGEKVRRVARLAERLAEAAGLDAAKARRAAELAKCDLETLIVYEFPELQGLMGRYYALGDGIDADVADAIAEHYRPAGAEDDVASGILGALVGVADRLDTLVGIFGIGLVPKGSNDPFALRRAALGVVRTALEGPIDVDLAQALAWARAGYEGRELHETDAALDDFFRARLRAFFRERFGGDVVEATLAAWESGSVRDLKERMRAVHAFRQLEAYASLAHAFKRTTGILEDVERGPVDAALLEPGAEQALAETYGGLEQRLEKLAETGEYQAALQPVADELRAPIDRFFDEVLVMSEDLKVRANRLRLLASIADQVSGIAHIHLLSAQD